MNRVIYDFVNCRNEEQGHAFFDGDKKAFKASTRMSRNQRRKFFKRKIVPPSFFTYLRESGIIQEEPRIPRGGIKIGDLLDFLRWYPYETEEARLGGEYLFREIIKADIPSTSKAFASSDHLWAKREMYGELKGNKGKKLTFPQN